MSNIKREKVVKEEELISLRTLFEWNFYLFLLKALRREITKYDASQST